MPKRGTVLSPEAIANNAHAIARWKKANIDNLSIGVRKGKREAYKQLAEVRGTTLSRLVQDYLDAECAREGIEIVVQESR